MTGKLKAWGGKPLHVAAFALAMGFAAACALVAFVWFLLYDSDMHFMIATGREILANGIPYENVWHMEAGYGLVAQQWLYDVVLALVDPMGPKGFAALVLAQYAVLAFLAYRLFRRAGAPRGVSVLFLAAASLFFREYIFSIRPQTITFILLLSTAMCLERWAEKDDWLWLLPLPLLTLLEINLHGATWPFHFCIVAAYLVPLPFPKGQDFAEAKHAICHLKQLGITLAAMVGSLFLNPYGLDGAVYVFRSYTSGCFDVLHVSEMTNTYVLSTAGICIVIGFPLAWLCSRLGTLRTGTLNMFLGFSLATAMSYRNYMFLVLPFLFIMRDLYRGCGDKVAAVDFRRSLTRSTIPALLALDLCAALMVLGTIGASEWVDADAGSAPSAYDGVADFLESENAYDDRIFTRFEIGSLLEYRGFTNIYMDNRVELYTAKLNGVHDTAFDMSRYAGYGVTLSQKAVRSPSDYYPVSKDEMEAWLEWCDFDYLCVGAKSDTFLQGYLANCPDYEPVYDEPGLMAVYARTDRAG